MVEIAEGNYTMEVKRATYYIKEIKENLNTGVNENMCLVYEKICEINKTLEGAADHVKYAMLDEEKSFVEVRQWYDNCKQDLIPVRNLRDRIGKTGNSPERRLIS